jgi:hypothetical protein
MLANVNMIRKLGPLMTAAVLLAGSHMGFAPPVGFPPAASCR